MARRAKNKNLYIVGENWQHIPGPGTLIHQGGDTVSIEHFDGATASLVYNGEDEKQERTDADGRLQIEDVFVPYEDENVVEVPEAGLRVLAHGQANLELMKAKEAKAAA